MLMQGVPCRGGGGGHKKMGSPPKSVFMMATMAAPTFTVPARATTLPATRIRSSSSPAILVSFPASLSAKSTATRCLRS
jgi:hypothetical protein